MWCGVMARTNAIQILDQTFLLHLYVWIARRSCQVDDVVGHFKMGANTLESIWKTINAANTIVFFSLSIFILLILIA